MSDQPQLEPGNVVCIVEVLDASDETPYTDDPFAVQQREENRKVLVGLLGYPLRIVATWDPFVAVVSPTYFHAVDLFIKGQRQPAPFVLDTRRLVLARPSDDYAAAFFGSESPRPTPQAPSP